MNLPSPFPTIADHCKQYSHLTPVKWENQGVIAWARFNVGGIPFFLRIVSDNHCPILEAKVGDRWVYRNLRNPAHCHGAMFPEEVKVERLDLLRHALNAATRLHPDKLDMPTAMELLVISS